MTYSPKDALARFDETVRNRMRMNNDALSRGEMPWICNFIRDELHRAYRQGREDAVEYVSTHRTFIENAFGDRDLDAVLTAARQSGVGGSLPVKD